MNLPKVNKIWKEVEDQQESQLDLKKYSEFYGVSQNVPD